MTVPLSPFTTARNPDGTYSLTLAQLTSVFIAEIERQLGPSDPNFTYVGLEFDTTPNAKPHIALPQKPDTPDTKPTQGSNHIVIRLTAEAQNDANLAICPTSPRMRPPNRPMEPRSRRPPNQLPRRRPSRLVPNHHHPRHPLRFTQQRSQIPSPTPHAPTRHHHQTPPHQPQPPHLRN